MANYNKQIEKWMTRASFDALDKSTIPEGTEINIVGDIVESDLSVELQNKINNAGGGGHLWKLTCDSGNVWGTITCYINTTANSIEELANDIVVKTMIVGTFYISAEQWGKEAYGQHIFFVKSSVASTDTISITASSCMTYVMGDDGYNHLGFTNNTATFQVEQLY